MRDAARASAPIGVFDSGIGGLTVLRALRRRLPAEDTVYLGDTARVPYGPKSPETVRRYAAEAAEFLLGQGIKLLVVACNTATARALPDLSESLPVPVIGVVEPGAREAARRSSSGRIGVIGTQGTVDSGAYEAAILALRPEAVVEGLACPLFVALVEEGWTEGEVARLTAERYLRPLLGRGIDTLVLGCTHYPLLRPLLQEVAGSAVTLVDSAEATADAVQRELERRGLGAPVAAGQGAARYFVTDDAGRFRRLAARWLDEEPESLETVELARTAGGPRPGASRR
ncbi:MAG: glutamate racemase [Candidatus Palauibacterales bacterium]|nr:glutamate racemase [Candidatus Palauibacterales bacterium]MDP2584605.1 glutamate racemase [Candidatus Palauibacterales bacterium]